VGRKSARAIVLTHLLATQGVSARPMQRLRRSIRSKLRQRRSDEAAVRACEIVIIMPSRAPQSIEASEPGKMKAAFPVHAAASKTRLVDVDRAKGLAIVLVVFGHLVPHGTLPSGQEWYDVLWFAIYRFHMPFFMYLSGFVFFLVGSHRALEADYSAFLRNRAWRLLVPFFCFAAIIVGGKYVAASFMEVANRPDSLADGVYHVFFDTDESSARSIWYVFVLFVYCAVTPLLWRVLRGQMTALLVISVAVFMLPLPDHLYLDRIGRYCVFFVLGGIVAQQRDTAMSLFATWFPLALVAFASSFVLARRDVPPDLSLLVVGALSIPVLHQFVRLPVLQNDSMLLFLGQYAFVIYLLNTIFIGLAKGLFVKVLPFQDGYFLLALVLLFAAGLAGPILLKRYALRYWPAADRLTS
jgi:fucose 4-O-acetylase-like acetyltransferase